MQAQVRVLVFGDSNTWGFKANPELSFYPRLADNVRWPGVMQAALGSGYVVNVDGLPGRSLNADWTGDTGDLSAEDGNGTKRLALSLAESAPINLLVVMLGTNDVTDEVNRSPKEIAAGLANLAKIAEANTRPYSAAQKQRVFIVIPPPLKDTSRTPFKDIFSEQAIQKSKDLTVAFADEARQLQVPVLDAGKVTQIEGMDGVHLTEEGHRQLGQAVAEQVRALVAA